jgi:DNA-binding CsgD family transcriptional regulator
MQPGLFHAPPGEQDSVQIVQLPVNPSRLLLGAMATQDVDALLAQSQTSPRQRFLSLLTSEEHNLVEVCQQHPYASIQELSTILGKSRKTVENQFRSIYGKLFSTFDLQVDDKHKRQALLDVVAGRV